MTVDSRQESILATASRLALWTIHPVERAVENLSQEPYAHTWSGISLKYFTSTSPEDAIHNDKLNFTRFEVLTTVVMKVATFWDIAQCSPYMDQTFGGTLTVHLSQAKTRVPAGRILSWYLLASWFLALLIFDPEDGGVASLIHIDLHMNYTVIYDTRRWQLSSLPLIHLIPSRNAFKNFCLLIPPKLFLTTPSKINNHCKYQCI
jgi:hypothetical protein